MKIPYYVAASYDINTLTEPRKVNFSDTVSTMPGK